MRRWMVACGAAAALVVGAAPASAGQVSGSTTLMGAPVGGGEVVARVSLKGAYPVVAYDYLLENRCWFGGRFAGPYDSTETYPLLGPWFAGPAGSSYSDETVNLNDVPTGSVCRLSVSRGSTPIKGTTTSYAVG